MFISFTSILYHFSDLHIIFFCFFTIYDVLVVSWFFTFFLMTNVFYLYYNKLLIFLLNLLPLRSKKFFSYFYFFSLNFLVIFWTFFILWCFSCKCYFPLFKSLGEDLFECAHPELTAEGEDESFGLGIFLFFLFIAARWLFSLTFYDFLIYLTPWNLLVLIFYFCLLIWSIDNRYSLWYLRFLSYFFSLVVFFFTCLLVFCYLQNPNLIPRVNLFFFFFNFQNTLFFDGISIFFILLTSFIIPVCYLISWNISFYLREYILCFFIIEFFLIFAFSTDDIFLFFISFESILIPMFLIIGVWGSRPHKTIAAYWFFFFTLAGSIFFLFAISIFYFSFGTTNLNIIMSFLHNGYSINLICSKLIWICLFVAFAVKIPLFPFHVWLPEAHVEAPTAGSVLLASLLLKLGGYGMLRFLLKLFPVLCIYFTPFIFTMCFLGVLYTSIIAIRQLDLKRLIAYSSVSHMNYVVLGLFCGNNYGIAGALQLMLSHGVVATALFILVGILYDRYGVRLITYYSGLTTTMPFFSLFFGFFIFSNAGFPMLSNFPGELLICANFLIHDLFFTLLILLGLYFTGIYSVWLLNRIVFGTLNTYTHNFIGIYCDLIRREFFVLSILSILNFLIGLYPNFFLRIFIKSIYVNQYLFALDLFL